EAHADVLAILLGRVSDPVRIAQRCHMIAPGVTVLIVADGTTCTAVEEQLRFAPFIRSDVQCVPARPVEHLFDVVRGTLYARRRRLDFQRIVATLNRKLSDATTSSSRAAVLLDRLLEIAPIGVIVCRRDGLVEAANPRAEQLLGVQEELLL